MKVQGMSLLFKHEHVWVHGINSRCVDICKCACVNFRGWAHTPITIKNLSSMPVWQWHWSVHTGLDTTLLPWDSHRQETTFCHVNNLPPPKSLVISFAGVIRFHWNSSSELSRVVFSLNRCLRPGMPRACVGCWACGGPPAAWEVGVMAAGLGVVVLGVVAAVPFCCWVVAGRSCW